MRAQSGDGEQAGRPSTEKRAAKSPTCGGEDRLCKQRWAKKQAKRFRKGKLGNSRGFRLPPRIRRMLDRQMAQQGMRRGDDWWDYPAQAMHCLTYLSYRPGGCQKANENARKIGKQTASVTLICGGVGIIGSLKDGGWWGFGKAGGGCLWTKLAGLW